MPKEITAKEPENKKYFSMTIIDNFNLGKTLTKIKDWDKALAKKIQVKWNLTDYQMLCLAFGKGFIIGALLL